MYICHIYKLSSQNPKLFMANPFDFDAFSALKQIEYIKQHAKPAILKKAKAGIVFTDYKLAGKKQACVFIPFKKVTDAMQAFKDIKALKVHLLKKTALVGVEHGKTLEGASILRIEIKKGGLSSEVIMDKGADFFLNKLHVQLEIEGKPYDETSTDSSSDETSPEARVDVEIPTILEKSITTIRDKFNQLVAAYSDEKLTSMNTRQKQTAITNIEKLSQAIIIVNQKATKVYDMDFQGYNSFKEMTGSYSLKLDQLQEKLEESKEDVQWDNAEADALEDSILKGRNVSDVVNEWNLQSQQLIKEIEEEINQLKQNLKQ